MIYTIKNEELICTVDSHGCELKSVKDRPSGKEYMWSGDPAYWNRTSPVLFPFVGAVRDKEYRHNGATYSIGQHGFARDMEFSPVIETLTGSPDASDNAWIKTGGIKEDSADASDNAGRNAGGAKEAYSEYSTHLHDINAGSKEEIWMELRETEETLAKYPFRFCLKIGYRLTGRTVTVMWQVFNTNEEEMYFAIGAHPGFMLPAGEGCAFKLYDTKGAPAESIRNRIFGCGGCVTGNTVSMDTPGGMLPITEKLFDGDALVLEDYQLGRVDIISSDTEGSEDKRTVPLSEATAVSVKFTSPLVGLWSPPHKNAPFVCIEPWYGRCDAEGFTGELKDREYEQMLKPGEDFRAEYTISFG